MLGNSINKISQNLYLNPKLFQITFKWNSYVMLNFPPWSGKSVNSRFFQYQSYKNDEKLFCYLKNHWKMAAININFHPYTFDLSYKSFPYMTPLSCWGLVNPSTSTFLDINLTKTNKNLPVVSNFTENWLQ